MLEKKAGYLGNHQRVWAAHLDPPLPKNWMINLCYSEPLFRRVAMTKVLHCADVTGSCDFVARGDSEQEILQQAAAHAQSAHNIHDVTPELAEKVRAAIRDEAA